MRIQPVQQQNYIKYNSQKVNFKGEFVKNKDIKYLMQKSNIGALKRFKEVLQNIKKVKDGLIFWVESAEFETEIHNGSETYWYENYYLYKQNGQDKETKRTLAYVYDDVPYSQKLSKINEELEYFYEKEIPPEDKNNMCKEIEGLFIEE